MRPRQNIRPVEREVRHDRVAPTQRPRATEAVARARARPRSAQPRKTLDPLDTAVYVAVTVALAIGWHFRAERYLVAERGLGYALGIAGGVMLLALLLYPLRKLAASRHLGSMKAWFRAHMLLGVLAPAAILFHANFRTGSLNDNVALVSLLVVAVSGLFGRYLYARIHHGLYGRKKTLTELRQAMKAGSRRHAASDIVATLSSRMLQVEDNVLRPAGVLMSALRPLQLAVVTRRHSAMLKRFARQELKRQAAASTLVAEHRRRLEHLAELHIDKRLASVRRVAEFSFYERLFSLWQIFHYPLFVIFVIAAVTHVVAVHFYQ